MSEHSRRTFLRGAGVSAAAVAVATIVPAGIASATTSAGTTPKSTETDDGLPAAEGAFVAYIRDANAGEISVMKDDHEVVVTNKSLAKQLAKIIN